MNITHTDSTNAFGQVTRRFYLGSELVATVSTFLPPDEGYFPTTANNTVIGGGEPMSFDLAHDFAVNYILATFGATI